MRRLISGRKAVKKPENLLFCGVFSFLFPLAVVPVLGFAPALEIAVTLAIARISALVFGRAPFLARTRAYSFALAFVLLPNFAPRPTPNFFRSPHFSLYSLYNYTCMVSFYHNYNCKVNIFTRKIVK